MDREADQEYLGEGLAEELLSKLACLKDLKVISRAASFPFRGTKPNLRELGEKLGVSAVLEGSLHKQGERLKITVKLINTERAVELWTEQYDIPWKDIFTLRNKIVYVIAEKLSITVRESERKIMEKTSTQNASAYDLYLRGQFFWNKQGEHLLKSVTLFQEALALDPQFALALAGMAKAYVLLGFYNLIQAEEAITKAKEAALNALHIDPALTEAYATLAFISMGYEWNWPEAEQYFTKVFAINPNNSAANERYRRSSNRSKATLRKRKWSPKPQCLISCKPMPLLHGGQFEKALEAAHKAVEHGPDSFMAQRAVGLSYMGMEKYDQAIEALLTASRLSNRHAWLLFELIGAYMLSGRQEEARSVLEEALAQSNALPARIFNSFFPKVE